MLAHENIVETEAVSQNHSFAIFLQSLRGRPLSGVQRHHEHA
jgi:hypothetical protein